MCFARLDKQTTLHRPCTSLKDISQYFSCSLRLTEQVQYTYSDSFINYNWVWSSSRVCNSLFISIHSIKILNPWESLLGVLFIPDTWWILTSGAFSVFGSFWFCVATKWFSNAVFLKPFVYSIKLASSDLIKDDDSLASIWHYTHC